MVNDNHVCFRALRQLPEIQIRLLDVDSFHVLLLSPFRRMAVLFAESNAAQNNGDDLPYGDLIVQPFFPAGVLLLVFLEFKARILQGFVRSLQCARGILGFAPQSRQAFFQLCDFAPLRGQCAR